MNRIIPILVVSLALAFQATGQAGEVEDGTRTKRLTPKSATEVADEIRQLDDAARSPSEWLNLYRSERVSRYDRSGKILDEGDVQYLSQMVVDMEILYPGTVELAYAKWLDSDYSSEAFAEIQAKRNTSDLDFRVTPVAIDESELDMAAIAQHTIDGRQAEIEQGLAALESSHRFSQANLEYHENVLLSATSNAWIFTHGTEDTYPLLLQQANGIRQDIHIVQLDWMRNEAYRNRIYQEIGVPAKKQASEPQDFLNAILHHHETSQVFLPLTLPSPALKKHRGELYPEGLLLKHSKSPSVNNATVTATWWETLARKNLIHDADPINRNYVIPLALLNNYYRESGDTAKSDALKPYLQPVARKTGKEETVKRISTY